MGLLAVMGPSRKDQRGPFLFFSRSRSKARISSQNASIWRSRAGKSVCGSTFSNGMVPFLVRVICPYLMQDRRTSEDVHRERTMTADTTYDEGCRHLAKGAGAAMTRWLL